MPGDPGLVGQGQGQWGLINSPSNPFIKFLNEKTGEPIIVNLLLVESIVSLGETKLSLNFSNGNIIVEANIQNVMSRIEACFGPL